MSDKTPKINYTKPNELKRLRLYYRLTMADIAKILGITSPAYYHIEIGRTTLSVNYAMVLGHIYRIDWRKFYRSLETEELKQLDKRIEQFNINLKKTGKTR